MKIGDLLAISSPGYQFMGPEKNPKIVNWTKWSGILVEIYDNETNPNKPIMGVLSAGEIHWVYMSDKLEVISESR